MLEGEETWTDDVQTFCRTRDVRYPDSPDALKPVSFVYSVFIDEGFMGSMEQFINDINSHFLPSEGEMRIRNPENVLGTSCGRGMDALSDYLLEIGANRNQYERIMRSANRGWLAKKYKRNLQEL